MKRLKRFAKTERGLEIIFLLENGIPLVQSQADLTPIQRSFILQGIKELQELRASAVKGNQQQEQSSVRENRDKLKSAVEARRNRGG